MEDYTAKDITGQVEKYIKPVSGQGSDENTGIDYLWMKERKAYFGKTDREFYYSECVQIENARYIRIDDFISDITKLTAIASNEQVNSLTYLLERILANEQNGIDLFELCEKLTAALFDMSRDTILSNSHKYELWLEEIRSVDLLMAVCRLRKGGDV